LPVSRFSRVAYGLPVVLLITMRKTSGSSTVPMLWKPALTADVQDTDGGNASGLVAYKLARRIIGYWLPYTLDVLELVERSTRASHSPSSARRRSGCSWGRACPASSTMASEARG
jgi:hypothetical protein